MAYTFGAGTASAVAAGSMAAFAGNATANLVCGWWYPTTLTATRGLWSAGNTIGAEIDTTTSELRLRTDNTTDGQWTTTGASLAVDKWSFLAFLVTCNNTGPAAAWAVWAGSLEVAPVEITVTSAVAPVGNFTAGTSWYAGNKGTGTLAFQGDIEWVSFLSDAATLSNALNRIPLAARGALTANEKEFVYRRLVLPQWQGEVFPPQAFGSANSLSLSTPTLINLTGVTSVSWGGQTQTTPSGLTISGATISQRRGPVPIRSQSIFPGLRPR